MNIKLPPKLSGLIESANRIASEHGCSVVALASDGEWVQIGFSRQDAPDASFESELRIDEDGLVEWLRGDMAEPWRFSPEGVILFGILYC